ncbi:MAG: archaemetzincin family Zn-dependent metalloprotease [Nitrospirales bacterium]|nr:archaemetzincin family Zn-dependent metalloprotease [Nitrospirales bacterium]
MDIIIVPIGDIESSILTFLRKGLSEKFHSEVCLGSAFPKPDYARNAKRGQYPADPIVLALTRHESYRESGRIIGVMDHDLYVPELSFVFGVARGRIALISLTRLRQEFYGLPEKKGLFMKRIMIEAVHELGHTFGLDHCNNPRCVMFFSSSIADSDRKGFRFCPRCRTRAFPRPSDNATPP